MSQLFGSNWVFSPIQREFTLDTQTIFRPPGHTLDTFTTWAAESVNDQVFTIVADGTRAAYIFTQPFANRAVRGTIANDVSPDDAAITLRDVTVQDPVTGQWRPLSATNNTMTMLVDATTIIGRNNAIVTGRDLMRGDQLLILSEAVSTEPDSAFNTRGTVQARIIMVE
jgi:hypothetical protein